MADNIAITAGSGTTVRTDDVSGVHYQYVKIADGTADSSAVISGDVSNGLDVDVTRVKPDGTNVMPSLDAAARHGYVRITDGTNTMPTADTALRGIYARITDGTNTVTLGTDNTVPVITQSRFVTCSTDVTRPADTTAYAVNDALSDSTTSPTTNGFTFTGAARATGGSGIITDAIITTSNDAGTLLQGEIWVFSAAVTNINDNTAFAVSDSEIKTCVGKIPFTLEDAGNNGFYHATNLNIGFTTSGSANLRFLVRVKNAYTPASAEVLTFVIKVLQVT